MSVIIRQATPDDAKTLSVLAERTFVETFGHLYPSQDLQQYLDDAYTLKRIQTMLGNPGNAAFLAEEHGVAVGHSAAGPCGLPHQDVQAGDGELKRLYLVSTHQNRGIGAQLFDATVNWLQKEGPRTLWVGVWSENVGAQRFYERYGFAKVGEYEFPVGAVRDLEFILRRGAFNAT